MMEQRNSLTDNITTKSGQSVPVTAEDLHNNPGVAPKEIAKVKSQYHFHKLSSVTLSFHTLTCTFLVDLDPSSIFYTPLEDGKEPVREYRIEGEGKVEIMPDALAVRVGEQYISSEEIYTAPPIPSP